MVHFDEIITSILFGAYLILEIILRWMVSPLSLYRNLKSDKSLLPSIEDDEILLKSATFLAKKIRAGELKSEDVCKAYIKRIKEVNSQLNAVVEDRFTEALEDARKVDELIMSKTKDSNQLESETPFLGVPITVKESCKVKGMSYCVGSIIRKGLKADEDGKCVKNIKKSGAIPIAITTTSEWCCSFETSNLVTGTTVNPYGRLRTPGGTSGGEAALIGSGASVCGIGSDIAGSIRIPSLFTGIFGHKPTPGYVSLEGHFPNCPDPNFQKYLVVGPMCRYAEDLLPMMKCMAGENAPKLQLDEKVEINKLKVFYAVDARSSKLGISVDTEIKEAIIKAVNYLHDSYGLTIMEMNFKELKKSIEISLSNLFTVTDLPTVICYADNPKKSYNIFLEVFKALFGCSLFSLQALFTRLIKTIFSMVPNISVERYMKLGEEFERKLTETLGTDGVFIYPSYPTVAFRHSEGYGKLSGTMYSMIFNIMGMPATQVPMGIGSSGLPVGFQVAAAPHQDRLCLAVAKVLGEAFGGWVPPPTSHHSNAELASIV